MRGFLLGMSLSLAFIVGCVTRPFVVPPAHANQVGGQRWEHFCFETLDLDELNRRANQAGREGWEFVTSGRVYRDQAWCFKRSL